MNYKSPLFRFLSMLCFLLLPAFSYGQAGLYFEIAPWGGELHIPSGHPVQCETFIGQFTILVYIDNVYVFDGDEVGIVPTTPGIELSTDMVTWHGMGSNISLGPVVDNSYIPIYYRYAAPASVGATDTGHITFTNVTQGFSGTISVYNDGTLPLTINTSPVCIGGTLTLSTNVASTTYPWPGAVYTWSGPAGFSSTAASPERSGVSTAMFGSYSVTLTGAAGCTASASVKAIIGTAAPIGIYGNSLICHDASAALASSPAGGLWSSSTPAVATAGSSTGMVTAVGSGTTTITYNTGCGISTRTVTVNPVVTLTGADSVCIGTTATMTYPTSGGTWTSSQPSVATVSASGVVTGISAGTTLISYVVYGVCGTQPAGKWVTVLPSYSVANAIVGPAQIRTVAGNGTAYYLSDGVPATAAYINKPKGITTDNSGNIYIADAGNNRIRKVNASGIISTIAGTGVAGHTGDGSQATAARINNPGRITIDGAGNLYFSEYSTNQIRKITASGIITTIAGTGLAGSTGDGGPATAARVNYPYGMAADGAGNIYIADLLGHRVRKINTSGIISTYAGTGVAGYNGENIAATAANLNQPSGLCFDEEGNLYVNQIGNHRISKITPQGMITTVAGTGTPSFNGDGGPATGAMLHDPYAIARDKKGNFYIADYYNYRIRKINQSGIISTIAGNGTYGYGGDGSGQAIGFQTASPWDVAVDASGNILFVQNIDSKVLKIDADTTVNNGNVNICSGQSAHLYAAAAGGTWTSSNTAVATVGTNGIVTGIANGSTLVTYAVPVSCSSSIAVVTVNVTSSAGSITGNTTVCPGTATVLTSSIGGGTWTSSNPSVASAGYGTGRITEVATGTATITYSVGTACGLYTSTIDVTVNAAPATGTITGAGNVCNPGTLALANPTGDTGGTWSSGNSSTATVAATTGIVTGVSAGTANISFTTGGCSTWAVVTVINSSAGTISGTTNLCPGKSAVLTSTVPSGTWTSGNTAVATVAAGSGLVTGIANGTAVITYTTTSSCGSFSATATVSVAPTAGTISGANGGCQGTALTLTSSVSGGTWSSSNNTIATVSSAGAINLLANGTATISYTTVAGCVSQKAIAVYALPEVSLAGNPTICPGNTNAVLFYGAATGGIVSYNIAMDSTATANGFIRMGDTATADFIWGAFGTGAPSDVFDITTDSAGNVYRSERDEGKVYKNDVYGNSSVIASGLSGPNGIATDNSGNTYVAEYSGAIKKISPSGIVTIVAGMYGVNGYSGDGGPATAAALYHPYAVVLDAANNLYIADLFNSVIRKVSTSGIISTFATVGGPRALAIDASGNLYVTSGFQIKKISPAGIVSTIAGNGAGVFGGDGGPATNASFSEPSDVAVDKYGNVYVSDSWDNVIRKISPSGIIVSIAGDAVHNTYGYWGNGQLALDAQFAFPSAIALDHSGNLFVADAGNSVVRKLTNIYNSRFSAGTFNIPVPAAAPAGAYNGILTASNATCNSSYPIAVNISNTSTSSIMRNDRLCAGSANLLTHAVTGGTWSSGNTSVATVGTSTGLITGVSGGTANITYLAPTTCGTFSVTAVVTVDAAVSAGTITGASTVCAGTTITLTDTLPGGVWSSGNNAVATAGTSGIVSGIAPGTVAISYSYTSGCGTTSAFKIVTVTLSADAGTITGAAAVCTGASTTLSNVVTGGIWSSSNTAVATVGSTSGMLSGVAAGTATITYSITNSCGTGTTTRSVTVNTFPDAGTITGTVTVCTGAAVTLSNTASGGVWSSGNNAVATVGTSGVVSGISPGTVAISYQYTNGCGTASTSAIVTVNPSPDAGTVTGAASVCAGASATLSNAVTGGIWSSSNTAVATVGSASGVLNGVAPGNATITYSITNSCGTAITTRGVTVNTFPDAGTITGTATVCPGAVTTLNNTIGGGVWSSGSAATATVGSASGVVTGVASGTVMIMYTVTSSCGTGVASRIVTVNALPDAGTITGTAAVCAAGTTTLGNAVAGGIWASNNTGIATVGSTSGIVSGIAAGNATITYSISNSCGTATATRQVTVNGLPDAGTITGTALVCSGDATTLGNAITGGVWTSNNTSIATVGTATGIVTGIAAGNATITYSVTNGCGTSAATRVVTINTLPDAGTITGAATVCPGATTTLSNAVGSGVWSSGTAGIATVGSANGVVTGIAPGTATISYSVTGSCGTGVASRIVTVNALPDAGTITGSAAICAGGTTTLGNAVTGGTWASNNTGIATVGSVNGIVNGIAAGNATITYSISNSCGTATTTRQVTVNGLPDAGTITGTAAVCPGDVTTLGNAITGGVWTSNNTYIATVGTATGIVTGIASGTATITYSVTNGCGTSAATRVVTVNTLPDAGTISGAATVCPGATTTLSNAVGGGVWSSGTAGIATVGSANGVVTGIAPGTATITYSVTGTCGTGIAGKIVTVNPGPDAGTISGAASIAIGATTTLSASLSGGAWTASNGNATVSATGVVTGVAAGSVTLSYSVTNSCGTAIVTKAMTVTALGEITGPLTMCTGTTGTLSNSAAGGTWTSSTTTVATISATTGIVTGIAAGTTRISYTYSGSVSSVVITVNPLPAAITGATSVCPGASIALFDATTGGTWSSNNAAIATADASSGSVTGVNGGTTTITYSLTTGCYKTAAITVKSAPAAITGATAVCTGATATYTDATSGGLSWSSSNTATATIGATSGVLTGIATGTTTITFTLISGCTATKTVSVNPLPEAITGTTGVCAGSTTALASATTGGTWSSSTTAVATVNSAGLVTGVAAGVTNIIYSAGGCSRALAVTVNPLPAIITGNTTVCTGSATALSNTTSGGTWSSSATGIAGVGATGIVTGMSAGTATISYTATNGCARMVMVTVLAAPVISGTTAICTGSSVTLSPSPSGGTWSSSNAAVVSAAAITGIITGVTTGTATVTYTQSVYCKSATVITVNPAPATITGASSVCTGATTTLSETSTGGTWASSNAAIATAGAATGIVTGISAGTATITYAIGSGCYQVKSITVGMPMGAVTGPNGLCTGTSAAYIATSPSTGLSWMSSNTAVATVGSISGVVTAISPGTAIISFMPYASGSYAGCVAVKIVTVDAIPSVTPITGPSAIAVGSTITLTNTTPGGTWSSNNTAKATVSAGGVVTGIAPPAATISYSVTNGACVYAVTRPISIVLAKEAPAVQSIPVGGIVSLYPNPTNDGSFTLLTSVAGVFTIFTLEGKEVQRTDVTAGSTSMGLRNGLAAGVYLCRFSGADGSSQMVRLVFE